MFGCCCDCFCNCDWLCASALYGNANDDNNNDIDNVNTDKRRNDGYTEKVDINLFALFFNTLILLILFMTTNPNDKSRKKNTQHLAVYRLTRQKLSKPPPPSNPSKPAESPTLLKSAVGSVAVWSVCSWLLLLLLSL